MPGAAGGTPTLPEKAPSLDPLGEKVAGETPTLPEKSFSRDQPEHR